MKRTNVVLAIVHKMVGSEKTMARILRFVAVSDNEVVSDVENLYQRENSAAKRTLSPSL